MQPSGLVVADCYRSEFDGSLCKHPATKPHTRLGLALAGALVALAIYLLPAGPLDSQLATASKTASMMSGRSPVPRRAVLAGGVSAAAGLSLPVRRSAAATPEVDELQLLEAQANDAYNRGDLPAAEAAFTALVEKDDARAGFWFEQRGQARVDQGNFEGGLEDFNAAEARQGYTDLQLVINRALAYEGLSRWEDAEADYSRAIAFSQAQGYQLPYALNSRGNVRLSLGKFAEAREDYLQSLAGFQLAHNAGAAVLAQSNAALCLFQLGPKAEEEGLFELLRVSRRAAASIDIRAALAAQYWHLGQYELAEQSWGAACDQVGAAGPRQDGCARYRDLDWLRRVRRWPPLLVDRMGAFLSLAKPT
eukprot:EG_transcript_16722